MQQQPTGYLRVTCVYFLCRAGSVRSASNAQTRTLVYDTLVAFSRTSAMGLGHFDELKSPSFAGHLGGPSREVGRPTRARGLGLQGTPVLLACVVAWSCCHVQHEWSHKEELGAVPRKVDVGLPPSAVSPAAAESQGETAELLGFRYVQVVYRTMMNFSCYRAYNYNVGWATPAS